MSEELNKEELNKEELNKEELNKEELNKEELNKEELNKEELNEGSVEESSEELLEEATEDLPFAKAEVVRLMKQNLDRDKMIRERVKVEMNKFLGEILENVCKQLNEYPYTTIEYDMFKESIYPYKNIVRINEEKKRILKHLDAIKADCDALTLDVRRTLKLKDVEEEEESFF